MFRRMRMGGTFRHRGSSLLAAALCLATVGAGARAGWIEDRPDGTVLHVTVWWMPDPSDTTTYNRAELAAIREFRRLFPSRFAARYRQRYEADPATYGKHNWDHVTVELHPYTGIEVKGVETDLLAIAGGMAPDVLYVNFRKSDNYIQSGFLHPLDRPEDGYLAAMPREQVDFRIHPKIWPVIKRTGPDGHEQVWAIPWGGALGKVLMYRKDLFDKKGVPYPTVNWTWDHMLDAARRLTDPRERTYGMALWRSRHEAAHWLTFLWSAGGEVMTYDAASNRWRCLFDSPEAAKALDFYIRLSTEKWTDTNGQIRRGYATSDASDALVAWDEGRIGMKISYVDEKLFARVNPEVTGLVPVPLGPGGKRGAELNSRMMGLFSGIEQRAIRDAAWEYMRYYDSKDAMAIKTRIMVEGGLGPFINPRYLRLFGYREVERLAPRGWGDVFKVAIETGRPEPYGRNSNLAYDLMTYPIERARELAVNDRLPADPAARLGALQTLLRTACARANEEMIGIVPPAERLKRRIAAMLFLAVLAAAFAMVVRSVSRAFTPPGVAGGGRRRLEIVKFKWAYLIALPAIALVCLWKYYPLVRGSLMAFQDYQLIRDSTWVGLDNFGDVLFSSYWWHAVWNMVRYSSLVLMLTFLPPILLAILLQEVPRGTVLFRTIYYLPAVITGVVPILLWKQFYEPSEQGVVNALVMPIPAIAFVGLGALLLAGGLAFSLRLHRHGSRAASWAFACAGVLLGTAATSLAGGILFRAGESAWTSVTQIPLRLLDTIPEPYRWLEDPDTAMLSCVIPMVWAGMGPGCLIYLAALKGISDEFYEAADIDGATFVDKVLFIVFPMLKPLIIINFVGAFIASVYAASGNILVMTGGGAGTEVAGLHIWYRAFTFLKFGPATAMAWILAFMMIGFTLWQLKILSRVEFRTTGKK